MNKIVTYKQAVELADKAISNREEVRLISVADKLGFAIGEPQDTCDQQKISELGGDIYRGKWNGGTCVVFAGDLSICIISQQDAANEHIGNNIITAVHDYLKRKNLKAIRSGNDILINEDGVNKKCASYGVAINNAMLETVVHVSIGMDVSIIEQVCTKAMQKIPTGLAHYGITANEIITYLEGENII